MREGRVGGKAYCSYLSCGLCSHDVYFMNVLLYILISYSVTELTFSAFASDERWVVITRILGQNSSVYWCPARWRTAFCSLSNADISAGI